MITQITVFTSTINGRPFNLLCSPDSPIIDAKQAICDFLKEIEKLEQQIAQNAEKEKTEVREEKQEE